MDNLKFYGLSEAELEKLVNIVQVFFRDIGMEFGIDKCAVLLLKYGVRIDCEDIVLPDDQVMGEIVEREHKYLGVLEDADIMWEKVGKEYLWRVKLAAKCKWHGGSLTRVINGRAIGAVRYNA